MAVKPLELAGAYKRTQEGHENWYFGGGGVAYDTKNEAYTNIPDSVRQGQSFGVWENGEIVEYSWSVQGSIGDGQEVKKSSGGGNASIDDSKTALDSTWSSTKISKDLDEKVDIVTGKGLSTNDYTNSDKQKVDQLSITFLGEYLTLPELQSAHPTANGGQFAYVGADKYVWSTTNVQWEISPDGINDTFTTALTAKLFGGKTFGKYENGDPILGPNGEDTIGQKATTVIEWALSDIQYPSYEEPSASLSLSHNSSSLEVGQTIDVELDPSFVQNDAGASSGVTIFKDGASIGTSDPTTDASVTVSETPIEYYAEYAYAQGAVKNDSEGEPYPTGQIPAGTVQSTIKTLRGYMKIFFGPSATVPATSSNARALPQNILDNGSTSEITLNTGSTHLNFSVMIPSGKTIQSVIDLDALNLDITSEYVLVDNAFSINDAGVTSKTYNKYVKTNGVPYTDNHRHKIIFG